MATFLSIDSSPSSFREHSSNSLANGLAAYDSTISSQSKKYTSSSKNENVGSAASAQGASQSTNINSVSQTESSIRGNSLSGNSQYQQQSILTNSGLTYPLLSAPYYGHQFLQSITTPSAQTTASYYQPNTMSSSQVPTSQTSSANGNNRRGGKKKAPLAQQQTSQFRIFFNLKKKEVTNTQRGPSHMYKPKNPLTIQEWFKRLTVEERINALTTIYPNLTETLINMNKRIEQSGRHHSFALKDPIYYDHKQISPMFYSQSYAQSLFSNAQSSSSQSSFEENFYCREQNETELRTIKTTEKEKFEAEQEIVKQIRMTDFNLYLDTLTVSSELVNNADNFLKLMANASCNQAFKNPCQFQFDQKSQVNTIEAPSWFKPKSFHSFATWIIVALEETLWAHQAKPNEMSLLFKDKSDSPDFDVQPECLAQFWKEMNLKSKKDLLEQLREKASKMPRENLFQLKGKNQTIRTVQGRDYGYQVKVIEFGKDTDSISYEDDDHELKEIIDLALSNDKEQEMLSFLVLSPFKRAEKRQDRLCREFFKCIKTRYQEELVEILLKEEQLQAKPKWGEGKKKKKKNTTTQQIATEQESKIVLAQDQQESAQEEVVQKPKKKKNKKTSVTTTNHAYSTSEEHKTETFPKQSGGKKKKRTQNKGETPGSQISKISVQNQEAHSCDEQCNDREQIIAQSTSLDADQKCKSIGKASSTYDDKTTAHQSITTLSNSSLTVQSTQQKQTLLPTNDDTSVLVLQQSKSVDCQSQNLHILKCPNYQLETIDTQSEESMDVMKMKSRAIFKNIQHQEPKEDEMNINKYLRELTNQMIDEVCQRFESDSSNSKKESSIAKERTGTLEELKQKQKKFNADFYQIGASVQEGETLKPNPRKPSFKKKQMKESNSESIGELSLRKTSFSMKLKEDKKFTEDYKQNGTTKLLMQSTTSQMSNEIPALDNTDKQQETSGKSAKGKNQRKGFGTKQADKTVNQNQAGGNKSQSNWTKEPQQEAKKGKLIDQQEILVVTAVVKTETKITESTSQISDSQSNKQDENGQAQQRKKRNRKKVKQNDIDIMNNFMKNLSIAEEVQHVVNDTKSAKVSNNLYSKKPTPQGQAKTQQDPKEQVYKQKTSSTTISKRNSETFKNTDFQSQKSSRQEKQSNQQINEQQLPIEQLPLNSARSYQKISKHQGHLQKTNGLSKVEKRDDDKDSVNSNLAETRSDNGQNYYTQRSQQQKFKAKQPQQNAQPFKYGNQQKGNEWETTSFTATSNTAEESSTDNNQEKRKLSAGESHILVQDSLIEVTQDKIEPSKVLPKLQDDDIVHVKQIAQQQQSEEPLVPPHIQSPESCLSSSMSVQAQCFTPKGYVTQNNYYSNNQRRQTQTMMTTDFNKNGSSSFQNTPNKKCLQTKPQIKQSITSSQSNHNPSSDQGHYKTPPQKASPSNYSQSNSIQAFKKLPTTQNEIKPIIKTQFKQPQRPVPQMPQYMNNNMNPYYMDQAHAQPNMQSYYGSPDTFIPANRLQQQFYHHPQQEGVFHYQEQNSMMMNNQLQFNQNLYSHHSQQYEYQGEGVSSPMSQSLTNEHLGFIDQSQDFIYQIFNQINQVNQPQSPVPMNITSPPPMMDYHLNLESELQQLAMNMDPMAYQLFENKFYSKLDVDIYAYCSQIKENINLLKNERDYVFEKILKTCQEVFSGQSPKLVLFGSLSTGLALESSDMDIAVTGLPIEDRYVMIQQLQKLAAALQEWDYLVSFKSIETASIPVIKMIVDISMLREKELNMTSSDPLREDQKALSVDITFDDSSSPDNAKVNEYGSANSTKTHLGLQSCQLVQNYVTSYPHLKEVAILLKKFLAIHEFNSPYYGGLSSYSTVLLLIAYMNYFGLKNKSGLSPSRLLMGYMDYYGNYFNPSSLGISTYNDGSFYQLMGQLESNIVILDPLNLQNNTTRNSYHTKEILQKFQCAFNNLKSLMLPQFQNKSILKGVFNSNSKVFSWIFFDIQQDMSPQITEKSVSAGINKEKNNDTITTNENSSSKNQKIKEQEEREASSQSNGEVCMTQEEEQPFTKMNLLEIFLAKDAQQVASLSGIAGGLSESKPTHVTQICLADALAGTVV